MKKTGQAAIFIVIALFFVGAIVLFAWIKDKEQPILDVRECVADNDCVPAECCDASTCVPEEEKPNCIIEETGEEVPCRPGCFSDKYNHLGCSENRGCKCNTDTGKCFAEFG